MFVGVDNSSIELHCETLADNLAAVHISARVCIMHPFRSFLFVVIYWIIIKTMWHNLSTLCSACILAKYTLNALWGKIYAYLCSLPLIRLPTVTNFVDIMKFENCLLQWCN